MPSYKDVHPEFRLNGQYYSREDLRGLGYDLVKEGNEYEKALGDFILDWVSDAPDLHVMTSGSTGKPKRIRLQKDRMVNSALATGAYFDLQPGEKALHCLPARYIAGKMMLVRAIVLGLELYYTDPSNTPLLNFPGHKFAFAAMVPSQVMHSLEELRRVDDLIIGGAPVNQSLRDALQDSGSRAFETFGMTETITHIALRRINPRDGGAQPFQTLPGVKVSKDDRGCLLIEAPAILDKTLTTNDLVELHSETHFSWKGRIDNVINSGGVKISPEEVEAALAPHIEQDFFLAGVPHPELGEAVILITSGNEPEWDLPSLLERSKGLDKYHRPKRHLHTAEFQYTPNGKLDRQATISSLKPKL